MSRYSLLEAVGRPELHARRIGVGENFGAAVLANVLGVVADQAVALARDTMREKASGADLLMVPELQLTGYPPEDLVLKPEFVRRTMEAAERLVDATATPGPALLFGSIHNEDGLDYNVMPASSASSI